MIIQSTTRRLEYWTKEFLVFRSTSENMRPEIDEKVIKYVVGDNNTMLLEGQGITTLGSKLYT